METPREFLERLEAIAEEPVRLPMPRSTMFPTTGGKIHVQRQEIEMLRSALREATAALRIAYDAIERESHAT